MQTVNISTMSVIKIILIILGLIFIYFIRDIILILFLSIVLASALDPWVSWFERRKLPRVIGVLIIYVILISLISAIIVLVVPPLTSQIKDLAQNLPYYYQLIMQKAGGLLNQETGTSTLNDIQSSLESVSISLEQFAFKIFPAIKGVIGGGMTLFLVLVLTFYLAVGDRNLKRFLRSTAPVQYQPYLNRLVNRIQSKMGAWLRGQLILSGVVFAMTAIGLLILGVKYWLVLALIAGILEVVPFIGPVIAGLIAVFLTLGDSLVKTILIIVLYLVVQELENHILVPKIMQKAVGLNPIVVILVILIGAKVGGVLGALIAIPVAAVVSVFVQDVFDKKKE